VKTLTEPPTRRNRSGDFSEFETRAGGSWQLARHRSQQSLPHLSGFRDQDLARRVPALKVARAGAAEMPGARLIADC